MSPGKNYDAFVSPQESIYVYLLLNWLYVKGPGVWLRHVCVFLSLLLLNLVAIFFRFSFFRFLFCFISIYLSSSFFYYTNMLIYLFSYLPFLISGSFFSARPFSPSVRSLYIHKHNGHRRVLQYRGINHGVPMRSIKLALAHLYDTACVCVFILCVCLYACPLPNVIRLFDCLLSFFCIFRFTVFHTVFVDNIKSYNIGTRLTSRTPREMGN